MTRLIMVLLLVLLATLSCVAEKEPSKSDVVLQVLGSGGPFGEDKRAASGYLVDPGREAYAQDLPHLTEDNAMARGMKYTHDASSVGPELRTNPAADQYCAICSQSQGSEGDAWQPCRIFVGKAVNANGWCTAWAPKNLAKYRPYY